MDEELALLRSYVSEGSEVAFAALVERSIPLVYGSALRRMHGDTHSAAEVTQQVFVALAKRARLLTSHPSLTAWLHTATRYAAIDFMRTENRRRIRESELAEQQFAQEPVVDWNAVRPLLDQTIDELSARDRAIVVRRYLQQQSYIQIADALNITEDAARMRADRALEKLRVGLRHRGVTSTTAALGAIVAQQAGATVPFGLTTSVTSAALAAGAAAPSLLTLLLMNKTILPLLGGTIAAGLTVAVYSVASPGVSETELQKLRSENATLTASSAGSSNGTSSNNSADSQKSFASLQEQLRQRHTSRVSKASVINGSVVNSAASSTAAVHRDRGIATLTDAVYTFAWASDAADPDAIARMIWFDPSVREKAIATMAQLPPTITANYPTPEAFYGFITAAICLQAPPPGVDVVERGLAKFSPKEVSPGRVVYPNKHEYQQTPDGWKWVFPEVGLTSFLHVLGDSVLTSKPQS